MLHVFPAVLLEVNVTSSPAQKVNGPLAVIVGTGGFDTSVTVVEAVADVQLFPSI